jgi:hypothetical protein
MKGRSHARAMARFASALIVASGLVHASEVPAPVAADGAVAPDPPPSRTPPTPATPRLDLSASVIRKAIADSRDPLDDVATPRGTAFGTGAPRRQGTDQAFKRAEIPTCMTPEAYKFDPPQVGPFGLGGMLALPFLVHAIATGKCRY